MGRLQKPVAQEMPESVLAPADSYQISYAPTLARLRTLMETWKQEERAIQEREPGWSLRPESAVAAVLDGYNDMLTSVTWPLRLIDVFRQEQRAVSDYPPEIEEQLLELVAFAREYVSATKDRDLAQKRHDTRMRLSAELLVALEDFA